MGCEAVLLHMAMPCSKVRPAGWTARRLIVGLIVPGEPKAF